MFQIKDFASIVAGMLNWLKANNKKVTDINKGSVVRTMLEAGAVEIEELYLQMSIGLSEAIPVSVYNTFGFDRLEAAAASGSLRFTAPAPAASPIPIPIGSIVRVPGGSVVYATTLDAVIGTGNTFVDVVAAADTPGSIGNTAANTITEFVASIPGVSTVTNQQPLVNGTDAETDADRLARFRDYIKSLTRGTIHACLYGAKTAQRLDANGIVIEYVASASLVEPWLTDTAQPVARFRIYIHNGGTGTTGALVTLAQKIVDGYYEADGTPVPGWKAAGTICIVSAATDQAVNVTGTVAVASNYVAADVVAAAEDAIGVYIQSLGAGRNVLLSELVSIVKRDVPGVLNVTLTAPAADVTVAVSAKAVAGTITLTPV